MQQQRAVSSLRLGASLLSLSLSLSLSESKRIQHAVCCPADLALTEDQCRRNDTGKGRLLLRDKPAPGIDCPGRMVCVIVSSLRKSAGDVIA
ncbi:hypothetical protein LZ32DRAFT_189232 [Colletotrichum eremochloae]|nr:hypothetical protein LZ32DRAFT_189232 [Colletotrichum eremochloae]